MKTLRLAAVAAAAMAAAALSAVSMSPVAAAPLPPQASPVAVEHTHGPDGIELDRRSRPPAATYDVDQHVAWNAADYDGLAYTNNQADLTALPTFHAVYVYPSDKASRFATFAAMFQADARDASALLTSLYGRGLRLDERSSTSGPKLDITVFRSKYTANKLGGGSQFNLVYNELFANPKFQDPNKKYMVWLDAPSRYCGQGNLSQDVNRNSTNANEARNLAIVYRPYKSSVNDGVTGGFCRGRTLRHELGHTMGALQNVAPHAYDGAHCNDSAEDTMCYTSATSFDSGGPTFDYNNDDYWDPVANPALAVTTKLGWWTVNLSRFVCPLTGCTDASTPEY